MATEWFWDWSDCVQLFICWGTHQGSVGNSKPNITQSVLAHQTKQKDLHMGKGFGG